MAGQPTQRPIGQGRSPRGLRPASCALDRSAKISRRGRLSRPQLRQNFVGRPAKISRHGPTAVAPGAIWRRINRDFRVAVPIWSAGHPRAPPPLEVAWASVAPSVPNAGVSDAFAPALSLRRKYGLSGKPTASAISGRGPRPLPSAGLWQRTACPPPGPRLGGGAKVQRAPKWPAGPALAQEAQEAWTRPGPHWGSRGVSFLSPRNQN